MTWVHFSQFSPILTIFTTQRPQYVLPVITTGAMGGNRQVSIDGDFNNVDHHINDKVM